MSLESLKEKILSDAEKEAKALLEAAKKKAASIEAEAEADADKNREREKKEVAERIRALEEGSAATVRLEAKKFNLKERRRVIDTIYDRALESLFRIPEKESTELLLSLLKIYAREGDVVSLSEDYPYPAAAEKAVAKAGYKLSSKRAKIKGGFYLLGKKCDRDVSYAALLKADREENQAELAAKIFKT